MKAINSYLSFCGYRVNGDNFKGLKNKSINLLDFILIVAFLALSIYNVIWGIVSSVLYISTLIMLCRIELDLLREQYNCKEALEVTSNCAILKTNQFTTIYGVIISMYVVFLAAYQGNMEPIIVRVMASIAYILSAICYFNKLLADLFGAEHTVLYGEDKT